MGIDSIISLLRSEHRRLVPLEIVSVEGYAASAPSPGITSPRLVVGGVVASRDGASK